MTAGGLRCRLGLLATVSARMIWGWRFRAEMISCRSAGRMGWAAAACSGVTPTGGALASGSAIGTAGGGDYPLSGAGC